MADTVTVDEIECGRPAAPPPARSGPHSPCRRPAVAGASARLRVRTRRGASTAGPGDQVSGPSTVPPGTFSVLTTPSAVCDAPASARTGPRRGGGSRRRPSSGRIAARLESPSAGPPRQSGSTSAAGTNGRGTPLDLNSPREIRWLLEIDPRAAPDLQCYTRSPCGPSPSSAHRHAGCSPTLQSRSCS